MVRAHRISEDSTFLGQTCALCKQSFEVGDMIVVCPEDGSRHHDYCWRANNNHCTAYGCTGQGQIGVGVGSATRRVPDTSSQTIVIPNPAPSPGIPNSPPGSKVRVYPARNFGCARSCLVLVVLLLIVFAGAACFGVYTLAESVFRDLSSHLPATLSLTQVALDAVRSASIFG